MFHEKKSGITISDDAMRITIGDIFDTVVRIGTAACVENDTNKVRNWMLEQYAEKHQVPATLLHTCKRWLCEQYQFHYHHMQPTTCDCTQVTFGEDEIVLRGIVIDGIFYDSVILPHTPWQIKLCKDGASPKEVTYSRCFLRSDHK